MFKINQIVYSVTIGKGKVVETRFFPCLEIPDAAVDSNLSGLIQMFRVEFEVKNKKKSFWYFWDGKRNYQDKYPELYSVPVKVEKIKEPKMDPGMNLIL